MTNITLIAQTVNTVIDKSEFSRIVREHDSDKGCKVYTTWCQFVWMLICHLGDCRSIRDVSNILQSTTGNLNHLGMAAAPSKSSVAYQNAHRDWRVFRDLYYSLLKSLGQHLPFKMNFPRCQAQDKAAGFHHGDALAHGVPVGGLLSREGRRQNTHGP